MDYVVHVCNGVDLYRTERDKNSTMYERTCVKLSSLTTEKLQQTTDIVDPRVDLRSLEEVVSSAVASINLPLAWLFVRQDFSLLAHIISNQSPKEVVLYLKFWPEAGAATPGRHHTGDVKIQAALTSKSTLLGGSFGTMALPS